MATRMLQRRGTAAQWAAANPVLGTGEIGYETDTKVFKVGDGTTAWNSLASVNSTMLGKTEKAADSDKLDGLDSTAFLPVGGKAADSNLLDGLDSTAFLRTTGKAADSDKLDGLDSTAFLKGTISTTAPGSPATNDLWIDIS